MRINWEVVIWTCVTLAVIMGVIALILAIVSARNLRKKREECIQQIKDLQITLFICIT